MSSGPCVVHGDCVCSSNYQGAACDVAATNASGGYSLGETCEVSFSHPVTLNVVVFDVQDEYFYYTYNYGRPAPGCDYDNLTVNEVESPRCLARAENIPCHLHCPLLHSIPLYNFTSPSRPLPRLISPLNPLPALKSRTLALVPMCGPGVLLRHEFAARADHDRAELEE